MANWPHYPEDEINAATNVLRSGKVNYWNGTEGREFEKEFANFCKTQYAIAVGNGTLALELALKALNLNPDDEVIVSPRSFMASVSCVVTTGSRPVFADIDPESGNITAETIEAVITPNTKAIIPVHLAGWPCDMPAIMKLAEKYNLKVIEDCAQAHGAKINGQPVGSFGDFGAFSFCTDKIISTAGEGGMLVTNSKDYWDFCWSYKDHGKSYDTVYHKEHPPGFRWLHESFGSNWRMPEVQSAIGRRQLAKLPEFLECRAENAQIIKDALADIPCIHIPEPPSNFDRVYYKLYGYINLEYLKPTHSRDSIIEEFQKAGIPGLSGSCSEIYLEKAFDKNFRPEKRLKNAQELGENSLMFIVDHCQSIKRMKEVASIMKEILAKASK